MNLALDQALENLTIDADWIGLRQVTETNTSRSVRDGKPQANGKSVSQGVMVEVMVQGQTGYCATNHLSQASIQFAAETAYQQAIAASRWSVHPLDPSVRPPAIGTYRSPFQKTLDDFSPQDLNDLLVRICDTLKVSDRIVRTSALARITEIEQLFVSSNGSRVEQQYLLVTTDYTATAQEGNIVQKRGDNGSFARIYQAGMEVFDLESTLARAQRIGEEAVELLSAEECPDRTTTLVLAPDQMILQIHESIGHPLEIDRILGDERNYAGSSFVKLSDFGSLVYGSPLMNVTFDPSVAGEVASYAFDDGGMEAKREYLIKDGLLLRGLGGLESQARANIPGVANFRACSWNRPPIDRMANLNLEPGDRSFAEIIESIEDGVYMQSNQSWSIDDYRRKFQFGCEYAQRIENGQLTKTLRNPNYRGITTDFWRSLIAVGNENTREIYGSPYCGKGEPNQAIRVGHASPVCAFANIEVFGGGK
jgi:predicted Zn-dependent protease